MISHKQPDRSHTLLYYIDMLFHKKSDTFGYYIDMLADMQFDKMFRK